MRFLCYAILLTVLFSSLLNSCLKKNAWGIVSMVSDTAIITNISIHRKGNIYSIDTSLHDLCLQDILYQSFNRYYYDRPFIKDISLILSSISLESLHSFNNIPLYPDTFEIYLNDSVVFRHLNASNTNENRNCQYFAKEACNPWNLKASFDSIPSDSLQIIAMIVFQGSFEVHYAK